jgi:alpha-D-ribose 1-methylphosphonate 5-triphosphate diphosphatase
MGLCTLAQAWCLVAQNPARALGLEDRGHIRNGGRADMTMVEVSAAGTARLVATIAAGKIAYCADPARLHMPHPYELAA